MACPLFLALDLKLPKPCGGSHSVKGIPGCMLRLRWSQDYAYRMMRRRMAKKSLDGKLHVARKIKRGGERERERDREREREG